MIFKPLFLPYRLYSPNEVYGLPAKTRPFTCSRAACFWRPAQKCFSYVALTLYPKKSAAGKAAAPEKNTMKQNTPRRDVE